MNIRPADLADVSYVAAHMREWDRREIYATRWDEDPVNLAADCIRVGGLSWTVRAPVPVAAIGAFPMWPGVWSVWMFATDRFPEIGMPLTRWVRRAMVPAIKATGAHRAQCQSMEGHTVAHRWLETLGAQREPGELRHYGKNRETFYTYYWKQ